MQWKVKKREVLIKICEMVFHTFKELLEVYDTSLVIVIDNTEFL